MIFTKVIKCATTPFVFCLFISSVVEKRASKKFLSNTFFEKMCETLPRSVLENSLPHPFCKLLPLHSQKRKLRGSFASIIEGIQEDPLSNEPKPLLSSKPTRKTSPFYLMVLTILLPLPRILLLPPHPHCPHLPISLPLPHPPPKKRPTFTPVQTSTPSPLCWSDPSLPFSPPSQTKSSGSTPLPPFLLCGILGCAPPLPPIPPSES